MQHPKSKGPNQKRWMKSSGDHLSNIRGYASLGQNMAFESS